MPKVRIFVLAVFVALAFSASSVATTGPGSRLMVYFNIHDTKLVKAMYTLSDYKGGSEAYLTDDIEVTRGEIAKFTIWNQGTKPARFTVMGRKTPLIKPGKKSYFIVPLVRRGAFPYVATGKKSFKGVFNVY